jgi:hypothetical protein
MDKRDPPRKVRCAETFPWQFRQGHWRQAPESEIPMKNVTLKVSTGKADAKEVWEVATVEFEKQDISVALSADAGKYLNQETALSLLNRQWQTDVANESRRERTSDAPKRVAVEGMLKVLMSLGMTQEQAEAKIAEARRSA